jgi:hypothetical protein
VFTLAGVDGVARVLLAMLRSRDADEVIAAHLFLRDVVNYGMVPAFTVHLPTSGIFEVFRNNLYVPDFAIRRDTIFTIGKIGPRANARLLAEAFPVYLQRDPLLLPGLLGELFWLTRHARQWTYLRALSS